MHPLLLAALCAAMADGSYAFRSVLAARPALGSALSAFAVATACTLAPLLLLVLSLDLAWRRLGPSVAIDPRIVERLVGGHGPFAATVLVASVGIAGVRASMIGRSLVVAMTPSIAAPLFVLVVLVAILAALVAAFIASRLLGPRLVALEASRPRVEAITRRGARVITVLVIMLLLDSLLPREYVVAPIGAVLGWTAGSLAPLRRRLPLVPAIVLLALGVQAVPRLHSEARQAILRDPPYGSIELALLRRTFDHDHDGYSPILGGGDCNDHDPSVNPGAIDVPGNGKDENCDGADAIPAPPAAVPTVPRPASLPPRPNIVVLVVDALRPDHLGFAGYERPTSPALDAFRRSATWFRRAYTPSPATRFALSSIFTGLAVEAIPQRRSGSADFELLPDAVTLAESLHAQGYDTVGLTFPYVINHVKGLAQGFRSWSAPGHWQHDLDLTGKEAPLITDAALEDLAATPEDGSRPLFLFAHYPCTHAPYIAHPEHDFGSRDVDVYDSALAHCDEQVGRLLHAIDARADADRTVVAVLSDHGEMFGEHGQTQHGSSMIEAAMRSVLLLRVPGRPGGATVDAPVLLSDLHATLLRYASAPAPGPPQWDLGAYLGHEPDPTTSDRLLFLYVDTWRRGVHFEARGVVDGRYKLVRDLSAGTEQLFDLDADPGEVHNARWRLRAEASKLRTALDSWNPTDAVR